jgi:heptose I phosphotransferase
MVVIARHEALLRQLGLATLEQVRQYQGDLVKNHRGRRDIFRIRAPQPDGRALTLYLKRNLKSYRKDGWTSLLQRGRVWSLSRQEWENARTLEAAGLPVAALVAYGEENGWLREKFSYLITEAATGAQTVEQFLHACRDKKLRRRVFDALARTIRKLHQAGLASPDLFTRHLFVDATADPPAFCLIDMARLDQGRPLTPSQRARDLAALNITAPLHFVSPRERVRFLQIYSQKPVDRLLVKLITRRMAHLLKRRKFGNFQRAN